MTEDKFIIKSTKLVTYRLYMLSAWWYFPSFRFCTSVSWFCIWESILLSICCKASQLFLASSGCTEPYVDNSYSTDHDIKLHIYTYIYIHIYICWLASWGLFTLLPSNTKDQDRQTRYAGQTVGITNIVYKWLLIMYGPAP